MFTLFREVSLRHFLYSPLRTLLVLFGIALGVAMLVATRAVNDSMLSAFTETVGRVAGRADLVVTSGDVGVPAEIVEQLAEHPDVAHIAGVLEIVTRRPGAGGPLLVLGVDFLGDRHFLPFQTAEGGGEDVLEDPLEFINDPTGILLSRRLAEQEGLEVGGQLELITSEGTKTFKVRGILADEGPTASFGGQVAVMFAEAAQQMFARGERFDRIDLALAKGADGAAAKEALQAIVGRRGRVERPEGRASNLTSILGPLKSGIDVAGLIALTVGMFLIYNAVNVAVAQRRREIGILRAIGVSRRRVVAAFCVEAVTLGGIGGLIGLPFAALLARSALDQTAANVSQFYAPIRPRIPELGWELALQGIVAGVLTTLIAAYLPARRAAAVDPVETLRRSRGSTGTRRRLPHKQMALASLFTLVPAALTARAGASELVWSFASLGLLILAGVLALPSVVLLLRAVLARPFERVFGVPGRLAVDNVERSLERSVLTVAALMVSVGSSICISTWGHSLEASMMDWIEQSVPADVLITAGSPFADQHNVPFRPEMMAKLQNIPGVEAVQAARIVNQWLGPLRLQLLSLDTNEYVRQQARRGHSLKYVAGSKPVTHGELQSEPRILVSENAFHRLGLKIGDRVSFETPTGEHSFEVRGVFVDYTSDQGMAFIDRRWWTEYWDDQLVDNMDLYLVPGADLDAVVAEVRRRFGDDRALFVTPAAKLREEIKKILLQSMAVLDSTDFITLVVAILGVIGTMLAAVLDRIREIGVLRAVGATRRQVAASVVAESGFIGLASAAAGLGLGVPMGLVFVHAVAISSTGWRVDYDFPLLGALRITLTVVGVAALAGLLPGRRAARMDVTEALAYE